MDTKRRNCDEVSVDDFMTGLIIGLSEVGMQAIRFARSYTWRFHYAVAEAFKSFEVDCQKIGLDVRFLIILDDIHGDSPTVNEAVSAAVMRGLVTIDSPRYETMRPVDGFLFEYARLPGGPDLYRRAVRVFIEAYDKYDGP